MTDPVKYLLVMAVCVILFVAVVSLMLWVCNRGEPDPFDEPDDFRGPGDFHDIQDPGELADKLQKRKDSRDAADR